MKITVEEQIRSLFGESVRIIGMIPVSGGDINQAFQLELSDAGTVFLKTNHAAREDMFRAEAEGLAALGASGVIPVVSALSAGVDPERNCSYLLLEYIQEGKPDKTFWENFGKDLALLHRQDAKTFVQKGRFGFVRDNYIGRTRQHNTAHDSFISFFREERLLPQIRAAEHWFDKKELSRFDRLLAHLDKYLAEPEFPSLLHGDLWSGNFLTGADGRAVLIDPAVYVGCAEADLAMTELFGGFSDRFYKGYREAFPPADGYEDRRDLYNLYHLLNHLNLFGAGYLSSVLQIAEHYSD